MRSQFFKLWGQKAEGETADPPLETDAEKAARLEAEEAACVAAAAKAKTDDEEDDEDDEDEDEEDEDDKDDKATAEAAAAVPAKVARHIRRAERARLHAIVDGAGPDRVAAALNVALNSNMGAKAAVSMLKGMGADASSDGRLGLRAHMSGQPKKPLGTDGAVGAKTDTDKAADGILAFASNRRAAKA